MKKRSTCPAACALDIAGDKWTLLVVRDLLRGRHTFKELLAADESIPTNILADRLKRMEEQALVLAKPYQENPVRWRYELTRKGKGLREVLAAMAIWGRKHIRGTKIAAEFQATTGKRKRR